MLEVRILPGEPTPYPSIVCGINFWTFQADLLVHFEQNSCEEANVFKVFDAHLIEIKVIHRFLTECSGNPTAG